MIIKSYQIEKIKLNNEEINLILFYGKNEGLKKEAEKIINKNNEKILKYDEKEVLDTKDIFLDNLFSKSLFDDKKIILINRSTDKILNLINILTEKKLDNTTIIFNADILDKKSKLRSFFEKDKKFICIPFYPDNQETLSKLAHNFFREKKILLSPSNINLILNKCNEDRENLINELIKIEQLSKTTKITENEIKKIINLSENYSVSELVDSFLAKKKNKIIHILNENNFNNEDCILISRILLNKLKKLLKLSQEYKINKNIDLTIKNAKPPIFWKDKEITKKQIYYWSPEKIKELIYEVNWLELMIKKNIINSINLVTNFILENSSSKINN